MYVSVMWLREEVPREKWRKQIETICSGWFPEPHSIHPVSRGRGAAGLMPSHHPTTISTYWHRLWGNSFFCWRLWGEAGFWCQPLLIALFVITQPTLCKTALGMSLTLILEGRRHYRSGCIPPRMVMAFRGWLLEWPAGTFRRLDDRAT